MAGLALSAEQRIEAPPNAVFDLVGAGAGAGWLFDTMCDRLTPGAAVALRVPLGGPAVELLGRIARIRRPGRIEIHLDVPWRGRLRLLFDAEGSGTRVRVVADLDEDGLRWLMRRRGYPVREPTDRRDHHLGLLTSKSGPGSVFAAATANLAAMAVDEINADGGIRGRPLRLVVGDDGTDPEWGAAEARRLVRGGCRTIVAGTTSATYARVSDALRADGVLLVHAVMNEGGQGGELRIRLGERPYQQLRAAAGPVMRAAGGRRWFLAGNDYVWPRAVHASARRVVDERRGSVVGEAFAPLGTRDFTPVVEAVLASGAEVVLSSFVGADLVAFERQCHAMGLRERAQHARAHARRAHPRTDRRCRRGGHARDRGLLRAAARHRQRRVPAPLPPHVRGVRAAGGEHLGVGVRGGAPVRGGRPPGRGGRTAHGRPRAAPQPRRLPARPVTVSGPETVTQQLYLAEATAGGFAVTPS